MTHNELALLHEVTAFVKPEYLADLGSDELQRWRQCREKIARAKAQDGPSDAAMLNWLEEYSQTGLVQFGFECEGGVYVSFVSLGDKTTHDLREQNNIRDAIHAAMKAEGKL